MAQIITDNQHYANIADAIREKNGETTLYKPSEMANAIMNLSSLNFEVVGGTTRPSSPKENTIWVNTTTNITNHVFSTKAPTTYSTGTVWFELSTTGNVGIKAIDDNTDFIELHPRAVYQRVSNAWQEKTASIYQNGSWTTFMNVLYVLKNGVVDPAMGTYVDAGASPMINGTIQATGNGEYGNNGYFSQQITLNGNFKTLRFHISVTSLTAGSSYAPCVGVSTAVMVPGSYVDNTPKLKAYKKLPAGKQWANIDISGLSGKYYISFCAVASFIIDEIVLTSEVF